jgi:hypothetical protein
MQRKTTNALLATGTIASAALWILDTVGRVQTAYDFIPAIAGTKINWAPIYLTASIGCASLLIAFNWGLIDRYLERRRRAKENTWDLSLEGAAIYVAFATFYGRALPTTDPTAKLLAGLKIIWDAAIEGKVRIGVCDSGSLTARPLRRDEMLHLKFSYDKLDPRTPSSNLPSVVGLKLVRADDAKVAVHNVLFADRDALRRVWLPSG